MFREVGSIAYVEFRAPFIVPAAPGAIDNLFKIEVHFREKLDGEDYGDWSSRVYWEVENHLDAEARRLFLVSFEQAYDPVTQDAIDQLERLQIRARWALRIVGGAVIASPWGLQTLVRSSVTVVGPPAPAVDVEAGDASAVLDWAIDETIPVTSFELRYRTGTGAWTNYTPALGATARSATVTGLTNGSKYTFQLRSVHSSGPSYSDWIEVEATPTAPATPTVNAPGTPRSVTFTAGNEQIVVAWTAPNTGGTVANYAIDYRLDTVAGWTNFGMPAASARTATITSLTNGKLYQIRIRAENAGGESTWVQGTATPAVPPPPTATAVPSNPVLTASAGPTSVALSWTQPGTQPVSSYQIQFKLASGSRWTTASSSIVPEERNYTVRNLTVNVAYNFQIRAINSQGPSDWVQVNATTATLPLAIAQEDVSVTTDNKDGDVLLNEATGGDGTRITYLARTRTGGLLPSIFTVSGRLVTVAAGNSGQIAMRLFVQQGTTIRFADFTLTYNTDARVPVVTATPGVQRVSLAWTLPSVSWTIGFYQIRYRESGVTAWTTGGTYAASARRGVVTNLTGGTEYEFDVTASNTDGDTARSAAVSSTPTTPAVLPDPVAGTPTIAGDTAADAGETVTLTVSSAGGTWDTVSYAWAGATAASDGLSATVTSSTAQAVNVTVTATYSGDGTKARARNPKTATDTHVVTFRAPIPDVEAGTPVITGPTSVNVGVSVTLRASSTGGVYDAVAYSWRTNAGETEIGDSIALVRASGTFVDVTLTAVYTGQGVTASRGTATATATQRINWTRTLPEPVAGTPVIAGPTTVAVGRNARLTLSDTGGTYDRVSYVWTNATAATDGLSATATRATAGNLTVTVTGTYAGTGRTATARNPATASDTHVINFTQALPDATAGTVVIQGTGTATLGGTITLTAVSTGGIWDRIQYSWRSGGTLLALGDTLNLNRTTADSVAVTLTVTYTGAGVKAVDGTSATAQATRTVVFSGGPGPVQSLRDVSRDPGRIVWAWSPPTTQTEVTSYQYRIAPAANNYENRWRSTGLSRAVIATSWFNPARQPFTANSDYKIQVRARDAFGPGQIVEDEATTAATGTTIALPGAVSGITGSYDPDTETVTTRWQAPTTGGPPTGYQDRYAFRPLTDTDDWGGSNVEHSTATSNVRQGRTARTYYIQIRAVNSAGAGPVRTGTVTIPALPPDPPPPPPTGPDARAGTVTITGPTTATTGQIVELDYDIGFPTNPPPWDFVRVEWTNASDGRVRLTSPGTVTVTIVATFTGSGGRARRGSTATATDTHTITFTGDAVSGAIYALLSGDEIWLIDPADPSNSSQVGELPRAIRSPDALAYHRGFFYISESSDDNLWRFPEDNLPGARIVRALPDEMSGGGSDVQVSHSGVLYASDDNDLYTLADPYNSRPLGEIPRTINLLQDWASFEGKIISTTSDEEFWDMHADEVTASQLIGPFPAGLESAHAITKHNNLLYCVTKSAEFVGGVRTRFPELWTIDINDLSNSAKVGDLPGEFNSIRSMASSELEPTIYRFALAETEPAAPGSAVEWPSLSTSTPWYFTTEPAPTSFQNVYRLTWTRTYTNGRFTTASGTVEKVADARNVVYLACEDDDQFLFLVDMDDISNTRSLAGPPGEEEVDPTAMVYHGGTFFIALDGDRDSPAGIMALNEADVNASRIIWNTGSFDPLAMAVHDGDLWISDNDIRRRAISDTGVLGAFRRTRDYDNSTSRPRGMTDFNGTLYAVNFRGRLFTLDPNDIDDRGEYVGTTVGQLPATGGIEDMFVHHGVMYLLTTGGLYRIDETAPANSTYVGDWPRGLHGPRGVGAIASSAPEVPATPTPPTPTVPGPVTSLGETATTVSSITWSWGAPTSGDDPDSYEYRTAQGTAAFSGTWTTTNAVTSVVVQGLSASTTYRIQVRARNTTGPAADADIQVDSATTDDPPTPVLPNASAPTVTITPVGAGTEGTTVRLSATTNGGTYDSLAYTWTVSGGTLDDATLASPTWTRPQVTAETDYTIDLDIVASGDGTTAVNNTTDSASATQVTATVRDSGPVIPTQTIPLPAGWYHASETAKSWQAPSGSRPQISSTLTPTNATRYFYAVTFRLTSRAIALHIDASGTGGFGNQNDDLSSAFEDGGRISVTAASNTFVLDLTGADTTEPYVFAIPPDRWDELDTFRDALSTTTDAEAGSLTLSVPGESITPLPDATAPTSVVIAAVADGDEGTTATLSATVTGGAGDAISYAWSVSGGTLNDATATSPTWTRPQVNTDTNYTIGLVVTRSGDGTSYRAGSSGSLAATNVTATVENVVRVIASPNAPTGLAATAGNATATWSWTAPATDATHDAATSYDWEYRAGTSGTADSTGTTTGTTLTRTPLTNGQSHQVRVRARNANPTPSAWTSWVTASPTAPAAANPTVNISTLTETVTEGGTARFVLEGSPAPTGSITINYTVQIQGFAGRVSSATRGNKTIRMGSSGVTNFNIATINNSEPDSPNTTTIIAFLRPGTGYTVGSDSFVSVVIEEDD